MSVSISEGYSSTLAWHIQFRILENWVLDMECFKSIGCNSNSKDQKGLGLLEKLAKPRKFGEHTVKYHFGYVTSLCSDGIRGNFGLYCCSNY